MAHRVGFIGLGNMGSRLATNILKKDGYLLVNDINEESKQKLVELGATAAESNRQIMEECDVVFLSLPASKHVQSVVLGDEGLLSYSRPGQYILDTSTIDRSVSIELSKLAEEKGVTYVDTAVSGGLARGTDGTLAVLIGGTKEEFEAAELTPYFDVIGKYYHYTGVRGGGVSLKIINNMIAIANLKNAAEGILMADHLGIPFKVFYDAISTSSGASAILNVKMSKILSRDYTFSPPSWWPVTGVLKDMYLAHNLAEDLGLPAFTTNETIQWYHMADKRGLSDWDSSSIVELLRGILPPDEIK